MSTLTHLAHSKEKARADCLKRLDEIQTLAVHLRATLYDPNHSTVSTIHIEMKGRAVAEAFDILAAVTEAHSRAQKAAAS